MVYWNGWFQNWEFEHYTNNRSNSYVRDGKLFIKPVSKRHSIFSANQVEMS